MSRRLAVLAGGLLLLFATPLCAQNAVSEETYGAGVHAFFSGDYRRAYDLLTSAITAGANDSRAHYFRGLSLLRLGREDEAKQDFQQGAKQEAKDIDRAYNVPKALERVQGAPRVMLERYRAEARILAFKRSEELRKARYEALRRDEERVLQQQATGAPGVKPGPVPPPPESSPIEVPGVKPVPAPIEKEPPAPGPAPEPAGKAKVAPPPTEPEANPFEPIKPSTAPTAPVKPPAGPTGPAKMPAPPAGPGKTSPPAVPPPTDVAPLPETTPVPAKKAASGVPAPDEDLFAPRTPGGKPPAGKIPGPAEPGPGIGQPPAGAEENPFAPKGAAGKAKSGTGKSGASGKTVGTKKTPAKKPANGAAGGADSGTPFIPDPPANDSGAAKKPGA